eukprot:TRINITY_DN10059_c0_g1_i1.p1 TRINITY_DN10059_c0_g1~~TRINITY_DN10059_c0_g1_i1.p1  ORF type:complete len:854 (+),score=-159.33 TRINITY_DN10059_c0_g1_i1:78-2639(+)
MTRSVPEVAHISIEKELKQSYLDYAMSVIIGRALPDVRDGLKPVHRRCLYAMYELQNDWNKPYKKSARIVGDVIGKYHPHGDTAIYDTIVRMAQPFSMRYLLVDGQGNFGSVDGDAPAAMRYTEIRMSLMAHSLLSDLEKKTVDFSPNYDNTETLPDILPTRVPNLLLNGASGIAVGMATNIPTHNLGEVIDGCVAFLDDSTLSTEALMKHIKGPDFPTAAIINGRSGILSAYRTGKGRIYIRAKAYIETDQDSNRAAIIVDELPYQVNKARLLEKIAEQVRHKKIEGISALRDESDKKGMRIVIEVRRGENAEVLLNNLYAQTQLEVAFSINMVALADGQPKRFTLKELLAAFIQHRREVVTRRSLYELAQARERAHILEGLAVAIENIDEVIAIIKAASSVAEAREALLARPWKTTVLSGLLSRIEADKMRPESLESFYGLQEGGYLLSPKQVQAVLDLRLHRLTGLEKDKIHEEYSKLAEVIDGLIALLSDPGTLQALIRSELLDIKKNFADPRRTVILDDKLELSEIDLIEEEERVVTLSRQGYVKSQSLDVYRSQRRGGRGKKAMTTKEEDIIKSLLVVNTHTPILCFSNRGKVFALKGYQIPSSSRSARGLPIVNLVSLGEGETITAILPVKNFDTAHFVFMATELGFVKKVPLTEFVHIPSNGKIAVDLQDDDYLIAANITDGTQDLMLVTELGKTIRFSEEDVRPMGRLARGVRGIKLPTGTRVVALILVDLEKSILMATENGYGQRTQPDAYRLIARGGQGVQGIRVTARNGRVVGATQVSEQDDFFMISDGGIMLRVSANEVPLLGRNTQGVRLVNLANAEKLVEIAPLEGQQTEGEEALEEV